MTTITGDAPEQADRRRAWSAAAITLAFLALVAVGAASHEMWRDEVRAFSIATAERVPVHLFANLRNEGHPALWYVLLYLASLVGGWSRFALPVTSALVAATGVWLLARYAPFPLWQRALFAFGAIPAYEYAVMCRNYGISMTLLFAFCALGERRHTRPLLTGVVLALLANTNVHAALLAGLLVLVWLGESARHAGAVRSIPRRTLAGCAVALAGCAACALQVRPDAASTVLAHPLTIAGLTRAVGRLLANPGAPFQLAFIQHAVNPEMGWLVAVPSPVGDIWAEHLGWIVTDAMFLAVAIVLARRPLLLLAFLGAVGGLGAFFLEVYVGLRRHQGLLYVFVIALLWLAATAGERREPAPPWWRWLAHATLGAMLMVQLVGAERLFALDIRYELSSAPAVARWLATTPAYRDAILVAEPDFVLETFPYYAPNRLYVIRERRFAKWTRFTAENRAHLTLGQLVEEGRRLQSAQGRPVLLLFGYPVEEALRADTGRVRILYQRSLSWDGADHERFLREARQVARFATAVGGERYTVYAFTDPLGAGTVSGAR